MTLFASLAFQIALLTLVFAAFTYACIIADPETSQVARICTKTIPSYLFEKLKQLVGQKNFSKLEKWMERSLQIVYLIIVLGSWSIIFTYGYEAISNSNYIGNHHKYIGYAVFAMCMSSWHYACTTSPGNVTSRTMALFDHYEYDNLLYTDRECPTLKIRKIARSKYDRCTNKHVPRFDHYCGWLNQAVGERNYRWFLLFLIVHVSMCLYGSWAIGTVLYGEVLDKNLLNATFYNAATGMEVKADYFIILHFLMMRHFEIMAVMLLMTVMSACLGIFLGFHLYITSVNMTTNEFFKWKAVKRFHKKETKRYQQALRDGKVKLTGKKSESVAKSAEETSDVDVGCTGPAGEATPSKAEEDDEIFDPGPTPKNAYNKGIVGNFIEVLKPLSFRDEAIGRFRRSLGEQKEQVQVDISNSSAKSKTS